MADKLIWSSSMTQDYLGSLEDEEKTQALVDRGYDQEMLDDPNTAIANDGYMGTEDENDFMEKIAPMINGQTYNYVILLNDRQRRGDTLIKVMTAEDLINPDNFDSVDKISIYDDGQGLKLEGTLNGSQRETYLLYAVPEDEEAQKEFVDQIMPSLRDPDVDPDDDDPYLNPGVDFDSAEELEDGIESDKLAQFGTRIKNTLTESCEVGECGPMQPQEESLDEAKSKNVESLTDELASVKKIYDSRGPEAFYELSFDEFERAYPNFTKDVIKSFLKEVVGISKEEYNDPEVISAWQGDADTDNPGDTSKTIYLIYPNDWPCLFEGAEKLANGDGVQWEKIWKKYSNTDESLVESDEKVLYTCTNCGYEEEIDPSEDTGACPQCGEHHGEWGPVEESLTEEVSDAAKKDIKSNPATMKKLGVEKPEDVDKMSDDELEKKLSDKGYSKLKEDFNMITLTPADQASNIRSLIKTCWDNVDAYSMYAQQLNEFGSQQALEVVNTLINDLYIAIGSFEDVLGEVDLKSAAIDTPAQVQAVVQAAPQVLTQPMMAPVMLEKFTLDEGQPLNENVEDSSDDLKKEIEDKEIQKANKEVEKYRKEKVKDSLNPDTKEVVEETSQIDEDLGTDDSFNPKFYESLLKLED